MPRLSDSQFGDYVFRGRRDFGNSPTEAGHTEVVVGKKGLTDDKGLPITATEPVASMEITRPSMSNQEWGQYQIDKENLTYGDIQQGWGGTHHQQKEEPGGQQRWSGGTMEPRDPDYVSWLGASTDTPKTVMRGMMGLTVGLHGSMPVADKDLTPYGESISKGAARKYGVQPHPANTEMEANLGAGSRDTGSGSAVGIAATTWGASEAHLQSEAKGRYPVYDPSRRWQSFTAAQTHEITQETEKQVLQRRLKVDPRVPVHPSQGKAFDPGPGDMLGRPHGPGF